MKAINDITINVRAVGIATIMAALVITLLAVAMTASPTMAQTPTPPQPCGPGALQAPDTPDETITEGHYAVFDGYWDSNGKTLNLNLCPPGVEHTIVPGGRGKPDVEVSTRTTSNVDIRRTVFHINGSGFEHTLTAADIEKYDFLKLGDGDDADSLDDAIGTTVWWLKVDDPSTTDVDEDSDLAMGFSAALFDSDYWYLPDTASRSPEGLKPLQYEFEVIREPGIPIAEQGHVFAFDDSVPANDAPKTAYWDSSEVDANALPLYPGEYHHFQWIFTKPATYEISVQLKGHVRQSNPHDPTHKDYDANWRPISRDRVVTSEVERYTFQIGSLTLNHEPSFAVMRSVAERSAIGTPVGDPIKVYQGDGDALTFTLTGPGHSLFSVEYSNGNAQIKVAGDLDHETRSQYWLTLGVGDNKNHEGHPDTEVDNRISVMINVTDVLERSVNENSTGGTLVGLPIPVQDADSDTNYTLSGQGSNQFVAENSSGDAQIKVAPGVVINYEDAPSYDLILHADTEGTEDVRVIIDVVDDPNEQLAFSMTANPSATQTVGSTVVFTGTVTGSPVATSRLGYGWFEHDQGGGNSIAEVIDSPSRTVTGANAGTREYRMRVFWHEGEIVAGQLHSNWITITWQDEDPPSDNN